MGCSQRVDQQIERNLLTSSLIANAESRKDNTLFRALLLHIGQPVGEESSLAAPGESDEQSKGALVLGGETIELCQFCIALPEDGRVVFDHALYAHAALDRHRT